MAVGLVLVRVVVLVLGGTLRLDVTRHAGTHCLRDVDPESDDHGHALSS
ncbi:hypothetical protein JD79_03093 [Geodermatophilus normandii]|uniref:Uncharacterized protein n=1 Tax=Geodermatophilus normandii TaxID=1137989 RepID=A0A317QMF8_9ACTN|nr:hypothetical protein [Geodermatophilus normandii]PWW23916.1 hypothetical protein JD79_03093 [Geodermatophilus normandii]